MKALTLWEPYASLIAMGIKTEETRSWAPEGGPVLVGDWPPQVEVRNGE